MKLYECNGKKVRIITTDNKEFEGEAFDYIPAQDNTPEVASISIGDFELFENDIKSIELI